MTRTTLLTVLASAVLFAACGDSEMLDDLQGANISGLVEPEIALTTAIGEAPDGIAVELELEIDEADDDDDDDDGPDELTFTYEVELLEGGSMVEVEIDATTGAVIEVKREDDDDGLGSVDVGSFIGLDAALAAARKEVNGLPVEAELEIEDDEPAAYEVLIYDAPGVRLVEVEIDARSGRVLEVEVEADDD